MARVRRLIAVAIALGAFAVSASEAQQPPPAPCNSHAVGKPWHGRLVCGVQLPAESDTFVTWNFPYRYSPNDGFRRWGTAELVATVEQIAADYRIRFGLGARLMIGDLSRPHGGSFGKKYGGLGHRSHQNGLDVDIAYPRLDGLERPPDNPSQIDRVKAQWLVDRAARSAQRVFIGLHVHLRRHFERVQLLAFHDDQMHVRIPKPAH